MVRRLNDNSWWYTDDIKPKQRSISQEIIFGSNECVSWSGDQQHDNSQKKGLNWWKYGDTDDMKPKQLLIKR